MTIILIKCFTHFFKNTTSKQSSNLEVTLILCWSLKTEINQCCMFTCYKILHHLKLLLILTNDQHHHGGNLPMKLEIAWHEDLLYKFFHASVERISQGRNFYSLSQHPCEINMETSILMTI